MMRKFLLAGTSIVTICVCVGWANASPSTGTYEDPGFFTYTVPMSGLYEINAVGAAGGMEYYRAMPDGSGGSGADISGEFYLTQGEMLSLAVDGGGSDGATGYDQYGGGGGGGGTFVIGPNTTPLLIAGGGGGGGAASKADGNNATNSTAGGNGNANGAGLGGTNGAGGGGGDPYYRETIAGADLFGGAGGAGFLGSGDSGVGSSKIGTDYSAPYGGSSFPSLSGGAGGTGNNHGHGGDGGFGGGGGGAGAGFLQVDDCGGGGGGGGGFSGGGGGGYLADGNSTYCGHGGGAGGSYNLGTDQTFTNEKLKSNNGYISIRYLVAAPVAAIPEPPTVYLLGAGVFGLFAFRRLRRR